MTTIIDIDFSHGGSKRYRVKEIECLSGCVKLHSAKDETADVYPWHAIEHIKIYEPGPEREDL